MRYLEVADGLRERLARGDVAAGGALPSEAELSAETGASRVTVRRALEQLRVEGLVTSRRGSGWFAAHDPVRQSLGRVTTVEAALEAAGAHPERRVLEFAFEPAPSYVARALELDSASEGASAASGGGEVLRVQRLNLADGEPFALVTVWVPGELGHYLSRAEVEVATFYDLLPLRGVALGRATQQVGADIANAADARHLDVEKGSALLTARRITRDTDGRPVIFSLHRYPARRTAIEIELPSLAFETATDTGARHG
ncbi:MAG TPA: GntR family transcriptional regulator [Acidimicrobiia bacterium]|jgi:GntR family transcriptional regulator